MSMNPSPSPFPTSLLSPLPPHRCSPETNRMASLINSLHVQTPKAEGTPLVAPLPPNPSAARAASGGRGCLGNAELLELSGCSGNFFGLWALPGGLFLQLLVFPHLFRVLVLGGKGRERTGHTRGGKGREKRTQRMATTGSEEQGLKES